MASSVMTVSAPFATDRSSAKQRDRRIIAKKPAAAIVSHIGKLCEFQKFSIDVAKAGSCKVPFTTNQTKRCNRGEIPSGRNCQATASWLSLATRS